MSPRSPPPPEPIATGDRRDEAHFETDEDQLVRAHFLVRPAEPPSPDQHTGRVDEGLVTPGTVPPVEDLRVPRDTPSVWDARPPEEMAAPQRRLRRPRFRQIDKR